MYVLHAPSILMSLYGMQWSLSLALSLRVCYKNSIRIYVTLRVTRSVRLDLLIRYAMVSFPGSFP